MNMYISANYLLSVSYKIRGENSKHLKFLLKFIQKQTIIIYNCLIN